MFLVVSRGLQPVTIQGYIGSVKRMMRVLGTDPTHAQLNQYIYDLYSSNYSYAHKTNTALGLERWTEFKGNPIQFGRQKKPRQMIKDTLTEAEVTKLIFSAGNIRDKAIITLLAYSGIRNKELCNVRVKDFDIGKNTIRIIKGKGLKDGVSNISSECTKILIEYLQTVKKEQDDFLFNTYQNKQMTMSAVRKQVHKIAKIAQIRKRVYPHLLRHSLAANMLLRGANVIMLQRQLRHAFTETTLVYLNSILFGEMNQYDKYAPSYI